MSISIVLPLSPLSLAWVCGWDMNASKQREVQSNFSHFPSYLFDYAGFHNNIYDGQKPPFLTYHNVTLNNRQEKYRWFLVDIVDDNTKFSPSPNLFNDAWKTVNETSVVPYNVGVRLDIRNEIETKNETIQVNDLICNVEYVK